MLPAMGSVLVTTELTSKLLDWLVGLGDNVGALLGAGAGKTVWPAVETLEVVSEEGVMLGSGAGGGGSKSFAVKSLTYAACWSSSSLFWSSSSSTFCRPNIVPPGVYF